MALIFVNYRTSDEEAVATLVNTELTHAFGAENVLRASRPIGPGGRFPGGLLATASRSGALLAVIGPRWASEIAGSAGAGTPDSEGDRVRREILEALEVGALVIPLLVGGAERLRRANLPAEIGDLADCRHRRLDHRTTDADLAGLVKDLTELLPRLAVAARPNGHRPSPPSSVRLTSSWRAGAIQEIQHFQDGGIGNVNGDFSGTFVGVVRGSAHTGTGHLYRMTEPYPESRSSDVAKDAARAEEADGSRGERS
ncbi:TIR domain-containing protein [Kitasatospora sp. NPDC101801]|uniref:TIR domain-containing protein n=1 Tax=Kitasatospora sp. NPDC101801 TaxID=3364103 RepID=UPI003811FE38